MFFVGWSEEKLSKILWLRINAAYCPCVTIFLFSISDHLDRPPDEAVSMETGLTPTARRPDYSGRCFPKFFSEAIDYLFFYHIGLYWTHKAFVNP